MNREEIEENKSHFGVVAEGLRDEIRQVSEGHDVIRQEMREFREEVKEEFKEVKSMIKFSYAELDQGALRIYNSTIRNPQSEFGSACLPAGRAGDQTKLMLYFNIFTRETHWTLDI